MYIEENATRINEKLIQLREKRNIIVWGAAENTVRLFQYTNISQYSIKGFADNQKAGTQFFGKAVMAPGDIVWSEVDAVVISSFYHENDIEEELYRKYAYFGMVVKLNEEGQAVPFYQHLSELDVRAPQDVQPIINRNEIYRNTHAGQRLFILCCGPSIQQMDLTVLRNEVTMAVHGFYLHKDIKIIRPQYYCNAPFHYGADWELDYVKEVKKYIGNSHYFYGITDKKMIETSGVYDEEEVNYYWYGSDSLLYEEIDFCNGIMPIQSVSILCIQLALYMGFKEIYLLGTEHDTIVTNKYTHFYNYFDSIDSPNNGETDPQGNMNNTFGYMLRCTYTLWEQYKVLKKLADKKGVKIYNATPAGVLDVFERVDFEALWRM